MHLLSASGHAPADLALVLPFEEEGVKFWGGAWGEEEPGPILLYQQHCSSAQTHHEIPWRDSTPPASTFFPDEAELRSQSMNTRKDEHTSTKSCNLNAWKIA